MRIKNNFPRLLIGGLMLVILLGAAYLAVGYIAADRFSTITRHTLKDTPAAYGLDFEAIRFTPRGEPELELHGWLLPYPASDRAIVLVHGFGLGGCRTCDFKERFTEFAVQLQQRGFTVVMFDLRGHGQSADARYTFGVREQRDVLGAVDYVLAQGFAPGRIGILGSSMGGAASILATASEPAIGALVTDSTFADLDYLLQRELPRRSGLPAWLLPSVYLMGQIVTGENVSTSRPEQVIGALRRLLTAIRSSLWFVPALIVLASIVLALGLIELDRHVDAGLRERWPRIFVAEAEGARAMLSAIATSMITVAGVVFSITLKWRSRAYLAARPCQSLRDGKILTEPRTENQKPLRCTAAYLTRQHVEQLTLVERMVDMSAIALVVDVA